MVIRELVNLIGFKVNETQFRQTEQKFKAIQQSARSFAIKGTALITAPFVGLSIWLGKTISDFEQLDVAFETMLGSAEEAEKLVKEMIQFAATTPFDIKNVAPTVKQLLAMGSSAETVLGEMRDLGNVASGLSVPLSRLALNFGQVRTQGKLTGRDLRDFAVQGVPLVAELAKNLGVLDKEIADMVSSGEIGFDDVRKAFGTMAGDGGKFANLMAKQVKTLGGMWSNFKDQLTLAALEMRSSLEPAFKAVVKVLFKMVEILNKKVSKEMKVLLFIMFGIAAIIPPLILLFSAFASVGFLVVKMFVFLNAAALKANISMALLMLKFLLIGAAIAAVAVLITLLIEDFLIWRKGGDSVIGSLINKFLILLEKINITKENLRLLRDIWVEVFEAMGGGIAKFSRAWVAAFEKIGEMIAKITRAWTEFWNFAGRGLNIVMREQRDKNITSRRQNIANNLAQQGNKDRGQGQVTNNNNEFNVTVPVKEGTPEQQKNSIQVFTRDLFQKLFDQRLSGHLRNTTQASPVVE